MSVASPLGFTESENQVFAFITDQCAKIPAILGAILYGSRARRTHHERSDYDIAIDAPTLTDEAWARFAIDLREHAPTLCGVDLVWIRPQMSEALASKIQLEGVKIYVKK